MKILNLYAGIGGNRKLWDNMDVTSVELDPKIAEIYANYYPQDNIIVGDAHQYLVENYKNFDFIWSSPPCYSHSRIRKMGVMTGQYPAVYPDLKLWEEVTLLKHFTKKTKWIVENVMPYYTPIIAPSFKLDRHFFWSNFHVRHKVFEKREIVHKKINGGNKKIFGYDLSGFKIANKRRLLRNMVNPAVGHHILSSAMKSNTNEVQLDLFRKKDVL